MSWWTRERFHRGLQELYHNQHGWTQYISIATAATLTYGLNSTTNVQMAIMTILTLVGASPLRDTLLVWTSLGAFVGGQNLVGATSTTQALAEGPPTLERYLWVWMLSAVVWGVWRYVVTPHRVWEGSAGRLGTTTFLGTNLMQVLLWGPLGVVDWNRYYYGFVHLIHVAEEADNSSSSSRWSSAWTWTEAAALAVGYVLAVVWLAVAAGGTRIWHARYSQQWHQQQQQQQQQQQNTDSRDILEEDQPSLPSLPTQTPPEPLNNILIPVLWALLSILLVNLTQYTHAPGIYNGFAVGSYVAMASLEQLGTLGDFLAVGFLAAAWGLTLTPVFVGFAGKAGFTALLGHVTYASLVQPLLRKVPRLFLGQRWSRRHSNSLLLPTPTTAPVRGGGGGRESPPPQSPTRQQQRRPQPPLSPISPTQTVPVHHPPKEVYYSKQQRRQKQRLQARRQQEQQQQQQPTTTALQQQQQQPPVVLSHRAWSLDDGEWQHPLLSATEDTEENNTTQQPSTVLHPIV